MADEIFEGRRNRLTDVEGRGGVEIKDRIERVRRNLRESTGLEAVLVDFFEDDLRETAASIGELEGFLRRLLVTMEKDGLSPRDLMLNAEDDAVLDRVDYLRIQMENLQRRMGQLARRMRDDG